MVFLGCGLAAMGDLQLCLIISFIVKQFSCRNRSKDTEIVDASIRGVLACERQQQWGSLHRLRVQGHDADSDKHCAICIGNELTMLGRGGARPSRREHSKIREGPPPRGPRWPSLKSKIRTLFQEWYKHE